MVDTLSSRGNLGWLGALLAGLMSAGIFVFSFSYAETLLVFFSYFSPMPIFVSALGAGIFPGLLAAVTGTFLVFLKSSQQLGFSYLITMALPVVIISALALRHRIEPDGKIYWYPEGNLLSLAVIYPCLIFIALAIIFSGQESGGLLSVTEKLINESMGPLVEKMDPEQAINFKKFLEFLPRIMPAMIGSSWLFIILLNLLFAQSTLEQQKWNLREKFSIKNFEVPSWILPAVAISGIVGSLGSDPYDYIGLNICFMLCLPLFLAGISIVHIFAANLKASKIWFLVSFYALLMLIPWLAIILALIGAIDHAVHFREKLLIMSSKRRKEDD